MAAFALIPAIGKVLDRVLPDKAANDAAKNQLAQMALAGELQQIFGQLEIDKAEAQSQSVLVAGWRPAIGWICAAGLASQFLFRPFALWITAMTNHPEIIYPSLDLSTLMTLVFAMLGIGVHEKLTS